MTLCAETIYDARSYPAHVAMLALMVIQSSSAVSALTERRSIQRVAELKRWLDPVSVGFGFTWMALHILAEPMLELQLRKAPLPVDMWSRWPQLRRPIAILVVSLLMATAAVGLR